VNVSVRCTLRLSSNEAIANVIQPRFDALFVYLVLLPTGAHAKQQIIVHQNRRISAHPLRSCLPKQLPRADAGNFFLSLVSFRAGRPR